MEYWMPMTEINRDESWNNFELNIKFILQQQQNSTKNECKHQQNAHGLGCEKGHTSLLARLQWICRTKFNRIEIGVSYHFCHGSNATMQQWHSKSIHFTETSILFFASFPCKFPNRWIAHSHSVMNVVHAILLLMLIPRKRLRPVGFIAYALEWQIKT